MNSCDTVVLARGKSDAATGTPGSSVIVPGSVYTCVSPTDSSSAYAGASAAT